MDKIEIERITTEVLIPEGYALVPIEPTHEMKVAGWREGLGRNNHERLAAIYKAMIAAAQGERK